MNALVNEIIEKQRIYNRSTDLLRQINANNIRTIKLDNTGGRSIGIDSDFAIPLVGEITKYLNAQRNDASEFLARVSLNEAGATISDK